jgi:hypothetical protein
VGERFQGSFYYAEEVSKMRDSDIDSLTADAAQVTAKSSSDPRTALADSMRASHWADMRYSNEDRMATSIAADLAERGVLLVTEPMLAAAIAKVGWFAPQRVAAAAAARLVAALSAAVEGPAREKSPIVEVVGLGDGTMNVKTEDGMAWHLTEAEYLAWPRAVEGPEGANAPKSDGGI